MSTESTGLIGDSGSNQAPPFSNVSPSLYNPELAPTKRDGRRWSAYNIFTLWANDVHSLGNYSFAIGLFALGLGGWQILLALGLGGVFLFLLLSLSGFMGEKTGVPFPVMSRISFGIRGAQIPGLIRGANTCEHCANFDNLVFWHDDLEQCAGNGGGDLSVDLVGRDLNQRLVYCDRVAHGLQPAGDSSFGNGLAEGGKRDICAHGGHCLRNQS